MSRTTAGAAMRLSLVWVFGLFAIISRATSSSLQTECSPKGYIASKSGQLIFSPNAWNATNPGSQCISVNADYTSFNATFLWPIGPHNVHSFPYVEFKSDALPIQISNITSLTLSGSWSMSPTEPDNDNLQSTGVIANVAWDLFADANRTAAKIAIDADYEIMFWLGLFGSPTPQPLGYPTPCLNMTVHDIPFNLYCGVNPKRDQKVFSWVAKSNVADFNFDFNPLLQALPSNKLLPSNVQLGLVDFGSEAFYATENVTFSTSNFGMDLQSKNAPAQKSEGSKSGGSRATQRAGVVWLCLASALAVLGLL